MSSKGETFTKDEMEWILVSRPGFQGSEKAKMEKEWDKQYGAENWAIVWKYDGKIHDFENFCKNVYEEAYFQHAQNNPDMWEELILNASNVYDLEVTDTESGFDYTIQNARSTHIQDIAIRNVVKRLGRTFEGGKLVRIRGHHTYWGNLLSPGKIPFHEPSKIEMPAREAGWYPWWNPETVEDAYQRCKYLAVNSSKL